MSSLHDKEEHVDEECVLLTELNAIQTSTERNLAKLQIVTHDLIHGQANALYCGHEPSRLFLP